MGDPRILLDTPAVASALSTLAAATARVSGDRAAFVGIRRGGVPIVERLAKARPGIPTGTVDIALYRDDAATALPDPKIGPSQIPFDPTGRDVILVDDVLQTGRTIRAAIDALLDYGRPRRVWLAVLIDRGGRELPIAPDFVGASLEVPSGRLVVDLTEGHERVLLEAR
jgi:pyrimidine operon attenuation protein/uracil phosphoribosyltransferase